MSSDMDVAVQCRRVLEAAWRDAPGYTVPNPVKYPWQWLWDSCFHAIAWSKLADLRALQELTSLLNGQLESGFLPNMLFHGDPRAALPTWGVRGHSTITQPPMYGHALRVLAQRGYDVEPLLPLAARAMHFLIDSRLDAATGLVRVAHPWETGCDDSPRWAHWMPFRRYNRKLWNVVKFILVRSLRKRGGGACSNWLFASCPASFNALVAFNARELAALTGDGALAGKAHAIACALERVWQPQLRTWADVAPESSKVLSALPTQEAFLPLLVVRNEAQRSAAWESLLHRSKFLRPHGLAGVAIDQPEYNPDGYWRGGCWPPVCYMLWVAAVREGRPEQEMLRRLFVDAMISSRLSEFSNPETGTACGAQPQSWTAIVLELLG